LASIAAPKRRTSAYTARIAAKKRRQVIFVAVLAVILVALLAYEIPHVLAQPHGNRTSTAPAAQAATTPLTASGHQAKPLSGSGNGTDPFAAKSLPNGDVRAVAGGPDPFTPSAASLPSSAATSPAALPEQIVIGRPGGHRVAKHGWIVILASIRTRNGQAAAARFARGARGSVGALSVLNSSNRRPLRGGYWVVYSGPYKSLQAVSQRAGDIHAAGYRTAYIRELIAYR
jgi:hypothetical protein